jgi:hypothetical protein
MDLPDEIWELLPVPRIFGGMGELNCLKGSGLCHESLENSNCFIGGLEVTLEDTNTSGVIHILGMDNLDFFV